MAVDPPLVLVLDDDESARRLVRMGLELEGATVVEAESLARARQFLDPRMTGFVLDRELPDGDGLDLLPDIGSVSPTAAIVVNSTIDDDRQPPWVAKVEKGDVPELVRALGLARADDADRPLAVVDLVRTEAEALVREWEELCRWDPLLPPNSKPGSARTVVDAVADALERPQPLGWGPDPALGTVMELFATTTGAVDVAIGQLVCLREALRRHLAGNVPAAEEGESRARVDMIIDRAIWLTARISAARLVHQITLDPFTGVGNRQTFDADLQRELLRAARYGRDLSVVVVALAGAEADLDALDGEDSRVRRLAGLLATTLRGQDAVYRLGAASLVAVLPETDAGATDVLLDRLGTGLGPGVTIGGASYRVDGDDAATLLHVAEHRWQPAAQRRT